DYYCSAWDTSLSGGLF
nr:immunoglobulin light chain junction region [Macaca mulatta]MOW66195.1 immunoglobulin light chain junction region [Macaca mulatta]MOW66309.1 immunoglobulin light chain junction region [Macaca mulatta]MOW66385.1 immunoglobulin light chain junction region [Macaca mulatta]MOW66471.1 immunoglobulin light chain junction region [Macaca mulatta]